VQAAPRAPIPVGIVVAIDGPSGSGKSTVARGVARRLGLRYLDTGAMYRAVTWLALDRGIRLDDQVALTALAETADIGLDADPDSKRVLADGTDVTTKIRAADVTAAVSAVSAVPGVRAVMVRRQREAIGTGGIVVEGRDIGTTVAPDAPVKVYLTADPEARARRRADETNDRLAATKVAIERRDALDSGRAASPLARARDALVIDSTDLSADEVIDRVVRQVEAVRR
jgi:CMP/dCMP kinase